MNVVIYLKMKNLKRFWTLLLVFYLELVYKISFFLHNYIIKKRNVFVFFLKKVFLFIFFIFFLINTGYFHLNLLNLLLREQFFFSLKLRESHSTLSICRFIS